MKIERIHIIKNGQIGFGPVVYWMSRDQRVNDNWALLYAQEIALERKVPLFVLFCLVSTFLGAVYRHYNFMLRGLAQLQKELAEKNIPFFLLQGVPENEITAFLKKNQAGLLVTDFDPLKIKKSWKTKIAGKINIPFHEVDAHNIVPCRVVSSKQEYGAYTIRPKIKKLLPQFLDYYPNLKEHPYKSNIKTLFFDVSNLLKNLNVDSSVKEVASFPPGERNALTTLNNFLENQLENYSSDRNDPTLKGQSGLSPYLHFGQISAQRVALEVRDSHVNQEIKNEYLEEIIVRRELSDNFCFYNSNYDSVKCFPSWAQKTLSEHAGDNREYIYSKVELEQSSTHDDLWNAAQSEMVKTGKMHGYMRMYWAKKILEWTKSPQDAMRIAIYLNDRYSLDGRDPNGYTGIAWSIGGVHDRAWKERPVFGKTRYMSYNGCKKKFDVNKYIKQVNSL